MFLTPSNSSASPNDRLCCQFKCCVLLCLGGLLLIHRVLLHEQKNGFNGDDDGSEDWTRQCKARVGVEQLNRLFPPNVDKYVLGGWTGLCGGLGNQMFRFASLYGIGAPYERRPLSLVEQRCCTGNGPHESEGEEELGRLFPVYFSQLKYINSSEHSDQILEINFAFDCCKYDNPQRMKFSSFKQKYVRIQSNYFQSYKFFESRRKQIRQIFQFGNQICQQIEDYKRQLYQNDLSHKLCVHTRVEDFAQFGFASRANFTEKGIAFVHKELKKIHNDVSVVLLGTEKSFLMGLDIDRELVRRVYLPRPQSRGEDLALGAVACDSLLITAPASTFSWWMGYLMPDGAPVFYDSRLQGTPYNRENFLPEWTPIKLEEDGTIVLD